MSTNNQSNFETSPTTDQQISPSNSLTTNQLSSEHARTSAEVEEIDVAQADQSDRQIVRIAFSFHFFCSFSVSWETDDEGDFYTESTNGRLSDQEDDDSLFRLGLSKTLIECYPMSTAEELSVVGVVCDICLNEYKTHECWE